MKIFKDHAARKIRILKNAKVMSYFVIPACPESFFKKDSRRAPLAGMTTLSFNATG
jgi:hypothetical protein